eukprot:4006445-Pleurochrysis_carterae.AAC.1
MEREHVAASRNESVRLGACLLAAISIDVSRLRFVTRLSPKSRRRIAITTNVTGTNAERRTIIVSVSTEIRPNTCKAIAPSATNTTATTAVADANCALPAHSAPGAMPQQRARVIAAACHCHRALQPT